MSWDLVAVTDSGYKKYRDQFGNSRYQNPDGQFTNRYAWSGTTSQGAEITKIQPDLGDKRPSKFTRKRGELDSYKQANDIVYDEPYENGYTPPPGQPFATRGYPLADYPSAKRLDMLIKDLEDNSGSYDHFSIALKTLVYDGDGAVMSNSERHTSLQPPENTIQLRAEFATIMDELTKLAADYGGVIITESTLKMREYQS